MTMQKHNFSLILKCSCYLWCCFLNVNNWSYPQKLMSFFPKPYWNSDSYVLMFCFFISYWNTHSIWKLLYRLWCWEGLGAGGEGDNRGWDGGMASLTRGIWVWVNSGSWWWTGRPGVLGFMGSQRVGHDWATELNWTHLYKITVLLFL